MDQEDFKETGKKSIKLIWIKIITLAVIAFVVALVYFILVIFHYDVHGTSTYRNGERLASVRRLQSMLELYFDDHKKYPDSLADLSSNNYGKVEPMPTIKPKSKAFCPYQEQYQYYQVEKGTSYFVIVCFPENSDAYQGGYHIADPDGFK